MKISVFSDDLGTHPREKVMIPPHGGGERVVTHKLRTTAYTVMRSILAWKHHLKSKISLSKATPIYYSWEQHECILQDQFCVWKAEVTGLWSCSFKISSQAVRFLLRLLHFMDRVLRRYNEGFLQQHSWGRSVSP